MRKLGGTLVTLLLVAAPVVAGCGDEEKEGTAASRTGTATAAPVPKSKLPADLAGTWTATLKGTELVDVPDDLKKKSLVFRVKFLETGGIDNGPAMFLQSDDLDLEEQASSISKVSGDRITLDVDCQFTYAVKAEQLTWTSIGDDCPHDGLSTVLTAGPWQRTSS